MKQTLDDKSRADLVNYRVDKALETLKEADYNAVGKYYNIAVNRLYYAAYYVISALLIKSGYECSTHAGVKTLFSLHFVKSGIFDLEYAQILNSLFNNRQAGDYEDFNYCDQKLYNQLRPQAEKLITAVSNYIKAK